MATFNLKDRRHVPWPSRRDRNRAPLEAVNRTVLVSWLLSAVLCLALAAPCPPPVLPWVTAGLLSLSGFGWLGIALTGDEKPAASPHLTAWDAALLSFAASFGVQSAARLGLLGA
ncbi:hypothetical protein SAMN05216360_107278 [Methylobacterium phyllostachyos]|uniref:Uncharacterized protein n=1 Tax=Methylobacterium phyllostachyos TaxID=582672 RepID=A0A1H0ANZ2_9HYPH|nr:hypothetical protein [Methylobacterium phyllostachyos]SDN35024.1 hypothetical protein SAMN05216360_107278 [Methylobacterium phyllostachyos]